MPKQSVTHGTDSPAEKVRLAIFTDRPTLREEVRVALGVSLAPDIPPLEIRDFATGPTLIRALHNNEIDFCILDGEAAPFGGMGMSYQIKAEVEDAPPLLLLIQRRDDAWLATWSRADAVYPLPVDMLTLPQAVTKLYRSRHLAAAESS